MRVAAKAAGFKSDNAAVMAAGINPGGYNEIVNGKKKSGGSVDILCRLCKAFNCSADYLLGISDEALKTPFEASKQYTGLTEQAVQALHNGKHHSADRALLEWLILDHDGSFAEAVKTTISAIERKTASMLGEESKGLLTPAEEAQFYEDRAADALRQLVHAFVESVAEELKDEDWLK